MFEGWSSLNITITQGHKQTLTLTLTLTLKYKSVLYYHFTEDYSNFVSAKGKCFDFLFELVPENRVEQKKSGTSMYVYNHAKLKNCQITNI